MTWKGEKQRHGLSAKGVKTRLGGPVMEKGKYGTHRRISGFDVVDTRNKEGTGPIMIYAFGKDVSSVSVTIYNESSYENYGDGSRKIESRVNWSAIGSQTPERAKLYAGALKLAAKISERINDDQED